jgi:YegS/Rv2252/BmrU family lipid kinase
MKSQSSNKPVSIIFNPVSGKDDPDLRQKIIKETLAKHGYTPQFLVTTKQETAQQFAAKAAKDGTDLVVVSGGDGTVMEVLSALVGANVTVAVLPAGTGNLLSTNLGIPTTVPEAVEVALSGTPQSIDLARTNTGRYFAIMGGMGLDAHLIHDADRESKNRLGVFAYFKSGMQNITRRRIWLDISLDGAPPLRCKVKTLLVANMGKITGGLQAVPTADPKNGSLEVSVIRTKSIWDGLRVIYYAVLGKTQDDPKVEAYTVKRVTVKCLNSELVEFDGEDGGKVTELTVEAVPGAVNILVPAEAKV